VPFDFEEVKARIDAVAFPVTCLQMSGLGCLAGGAVQSKLPQPLGVRLAFSVASAFSLLPPVRAARLDRMEALRACSKEHDERLAHNPLMHSSRIRAG
jgi:hypothetical protein